MPSRKEVFKQIDFSQCKFDEENKRFYHYPSSHDKKRKCMTGLLPVLRNIYWPNYSNPKAKFKKDLSLYQKPKNKKKKNCHELSDMLGPIARGSIVHDQVRMMSECDKISFVKKHGTNVHPFTKKIRIWLKENNWKQIMNEVPISDPETGIATAIDSVLYNEKTGKLAIAEWKTGSLEFFYKYKSKRMKKLPLEINDSLFSQAQLQIIMTHFILMKNYLRFIKGLDISKLLIVHANDEGIREHTLKPEDQFDVQCHIYKNLKKLRAKNN